MKTISRIASIRSSVSLHSSITGLTAFHLADLSLKGPQDFQLPDNLRLGHLAERVVGALIKSSSNFRVLHENIQITAGNDTIGELDFILENRNTQEVIHLELAYKFYLLDPTLSPQPVNNWIGPNRNDSLSEKLKKLKTKQFPLLHHTLTAVQLSDIDISKVSQALCLMVNLFVPYEQDVALNSAYIPGVKGYYCDFETFSSLDSPDKSYYLPLKKEWGIDPSENETWAKFEEIEGPLNKSLGEKRALLCWQKQEEVFTEFFVVWW